jgi:hypothetical protein
MGNKVTISFGGWTTVIFLVLLLCKLWGAINISWFWVFFPLWIGWALVGGAFVLMGILAVIVAVFDNLS